jgi:hypothetical protein
VTYVDNCLVLCPQQKPIDDFIKLIKKDYDPTDASDLSTFLRIQINKVCAPSGSFEYALKQPALITKVCGTVPLTGTRRLHNTPADIIFYKGGEPRKTNFHYHSAIGQLNYLTSSTWPKLMLVTHQCAQFSADPRLPHEQAVKGIVGYLKLTQDKGLITKKKLV